jgi:RHS repeat-associated protein
MGDTTANGGEDLAKTLDKTGGCNTAAGGVGQVNDVAVGAAGAGVSPASGKDGDPQNEGDECREEGHPVEVISGQVVDREIDLVLPGPIRVAWRRLYFSSFHADRSPLGRGGWTHELHQFIGVVKDDLVLRGPGGRNLVLPAIDPGATVLVRGSRLEVTREKDDRWRVKSLETRLTRIFAPVEPGGLAMLRAIKDAWGNEVELVYELGRLTTVKAFGRELRITHDAKGNVLRVEAWAEGASRQAVAYAYSAHGELARATDALGHADQYAYDGLHRMVRTTLKNGVSFHYRYDDATGRCVRTWGDGGLHDVELTYDMTAGETIAASDHVRVYTWKGGALTKESTPDGDSSTEFVYDDDGLVLVKKSAAGEKWEHEYDERGHCVKTTDPAGNETKWVFRDDRPVRRVSPDGLVSKVVHNPQGAPLEVHLPTGETFQFGYDGAGHLAYVYGSDGMLASYAYDEKQNLVAETDARGGKTTYTYDPLGLPIEQTDALGRVTRAEYDVMGRATKITCPDGSRVEFAYDAMGNLVRRVDAMGRVMRMEYAGTGVLVAQILPNGQVWRFLYDSSERLRTIVNPKKEEYRFTYDRAGRVVEERTFDGRVLRYGYDKGDRLRRIDYPDETFREFAYDPLGYVVKETSSHGPHLFKRDKLGRLLEATAVDHNGKTVVKFERDELGRVVSEIQNGAEVKSAYDRRGQRSTRVLPGGETTAYRYDRAGGLVGLEHEGHKVAISRDEQGRPTLLASGRLVEIASTYDAMGRLESRIANAASRPGQAAQRALSERKWSHDSNGRVVGIDDGRWGSTRYAYDELGQLIEAQRGKAHEVFYYDGAGSLSAAVEGLTSRAVPWTLAEGNVLLQTEEGTLRYDARRRRVSETSAAGKVTTYFWDCRDWLREVELADGRRVLYTYDPFGRRVRKDIVLPSSDPTKPPEREQCVAFVWDGNVLAQEIDSDRGKRVFVHAELMPVLQQEQGEIFTYVLDQLGTPRELVDAGGRVAWSAAYSAWGEVTETWREPATKSVESPFRFLGQYYDDETGFSYTRFRYFDAKHGRWVSPDPLGIAGGGNLMGFNGSPSNDVDPFGLMPLSIPTIQGHHMVPHSLATELDMSPFNSQFGVPSYFFSPNCPDDAHSLMHGYGQDDVVPPATRVGQYEGRELTPTQWMQSLEDHYNDPEIQHLRGDLRIVTDEGPGEMLAKNVSPAEAWKKTKAWACKNKGKK